MKKHLGTLAIATAVCMTLGDAAQAATMGYSHADERMILKGQERPSSAIHREKISHRRTVAYRTHLMTPRRTVVVRERAIPQRRTVAYRTHFMRPRRTVAVRERIIPHRRTVAYRTHFIPHRRTVAYRTHFIPHRRTVAYRTHFIPHRRTVAYRTHFIPHRRTVAYRTHFPHRRVVAFRRPMMVQRTIIYQPAPIASYEPVTYREPSLFERIVTWPGRAAVTAVRTPVIIGETAAGERTFVNDSGQFFGRRDLAAYRPATYQTVTSQPVVYQPMTVRRVAYRPVTARRVVAYRPVTARRVVAYRPVTTYQRTYVARPAARRLVSTTTTEPLPVRTGRTIVRTPLIIGETLTGQRHVVSNEGRMFAANEY